MSSLNLEIDPTYSKRKKEEQALSLYQTLIQNNPDMTVGAAQELLDGINKTGTLPAQVPSGKMETLPAEGPALPAQGPTLPGMPQPQSPVMTQVPGMLDVAGMKLHRNERTALIGQNTATGELKMEDPNSPLGQLLSDPDVKPHFYNYNPKSKKDEERQGYATYYDKKTGKTIRREPAKSDHYIGVGDTGGGGNDMEEIRKKEAQKALGEFDKWQKENPDEEVPDQLRQRAADANKYLGFPNAKKKVKTGFLGLGKGKVVETPAFNKQTEFQSEDEAKASGLPHGSIVTINGKKFRLEY